MRRIIRRAVARKNADISKTTEWRIAQRDPTFPKPVRISTGLTGYYEDEFDAWLAARPRVGDEDASPILEAGAPP